MNLLAVMFPIYVMGNLHCIGMCGPIAMMLGKSPFRSFYLLGRLLSFTLAGFVAGGFGEILALALSEYYIGASLSIMVGLVMIISGLCIIFGVPFFHQMAPLRERLNLLFFSQEPWPLFLVGFLTIALPCGQTLLVYSACALSGSAASGTLNGFVFGLLTTPSLYLAMRGSKVLGHLRRLYKPVVGGLSIGIGGIAILRGIADIGWISHFGIHPLIIY